MTGLAKLLEKLEMEAIWDLREDSAKDELTLMERKMAGNLV